ncbi:hypothetical protein ACFQVD_37025 [Streptosporangium amethystogenes subsp. fukuiense]|uniref:RiboL-PSP-HEPN domain-containing protein n=1 Tax=Streptosporangium amethystogenes subsp. fukuiense TaxID=698418 RepID=A0ABW2TDS7_9ACTN
MTTPEFQEFTKSIEYANGLITGGNAIQGLKAAAKASGADYGNLTAAHPEDLYRAAWTQAVSTFDYWLRREIINRAAHLIDDLGNTRTDTLNRLRIPFAVVEEMRNKEEHEVFKKFLAEELQRETYHTTEQIAKGLRLLLLGNADVIWTQIGRHLMMTPVDVKRRHDKEVIKRRNDIAHRSDRDPRGDPTPMTAREAQETLEWISDLATAIAKLLD